MCGIQQSISHTILPRRVINMRRIESVIFKGIINKSLTVSYIYTVKLNEGHFNTIEEDNKGNIKIYPEYMIQINPGYPLQRFFVSSQKYYAFISMFDKAVKLIQEHLFELFPNISRSEFEIDERTLERFQTEKALCVANISMMPAVYFDSSKQCYPGLKICATDKSDNIILPLEDCISINKLFTIFDPNTYGLNILSQFIKIE